MYEETDILASSIESLFGALFLSDDSTLEDLVGTA